MEYFVENGLVYATDGKAVWYVGLAIFPEVVVITENPTVGNEVSFVIRLRDWQGNLVELPVDVGVRINDGQEEVVRLDEDGKVEIVFVPQEPGKNTIRVRAMDTQYRVRGMQEVILEVGE